MEERFSVCLFVLFVLFVCLIVDVFRPRLERVDEWTGQSVVSRDGRGEVGHSGRSDGKNGNQEPQAADVGRLIVRAPRLASGRGGKNLCLPGRGNNVPAVARRSGSQGRSLPEASCEGWEGCDDVARGEKGGGV